MIPLVLALSVCGILLPLLHCCSPSCEMGVHVVADNWLQIQDSVQCYWLPLFFLCFYEHHCPLIARTLPHKDSNGKCLSSSSGNWSTLSTVQMFLFMNMW